jgi:hypothetical protein
LEFIEKVANFLDEPGNEIYKGRGASIDEIEGAQNKLGVIFDPDYINFVQAFGGSFVGVAIYGFNNSKMLESSSVVDLTDRFRRDGWPGAEGAYVISMDMSGNPVMIDASGSVFTYDHDSGDTRSMAASFRDFVEALRALLKFPIAQPDHRAARPARYLGTDVLRSGSRLPCLSSRSMWQSSWTSAWPREGDYPHH